MREPVTEIYLSGLVFGECPRWHDGALWLSDMFGGRVLRVPAMGQAQTVVELPAGRPSGLAFLADGSLLVVSMRDRRLLRRWPDGRTEPFADLSGHVAGDVNDMVRAPDGGVFVGNFGFDLFGNAAGCLTALHHVDVHGRVRAVAHDLNFPNGMAVTPDGATLIVAETFAHRLTAFDIDGHTLRNRRVFADLGECAPDGICLDAAGAVWASAFVGDAFLRVESGGRITDRVSLNNRRAVACNLGGVDGRTLFMVTADTDVERLAGGDSTARVEVLEVDVPGAGSP
ncbi:MAG TPA: gluconolactonase [Gammaproteobacteria bacterium]|uniref:SMP-30/gluconolactonase/LRE family protein n=1 Tax=Immundisolibacter sp. TaxID=1934948 RepID=UPI000E9D3B6A|nr:gluconolactonase [Gammaproteobacteria bacterium]HCZ48879.1 gluconolactonase [Gammaproteobacteria bacterium]MCH78317.1 gluconolactonase [Gammaproteobacteria bacterium]